MFGIGRLKKAARRGPPLSPEEAAAQLETRIFREKTVDERVRDKGGHRTNSPEDIWARRMGANGRPD